MKPEQHLAQDQELVQALVEAAGGLVDGGDDGTPSRSKLSQDLHAVHSCRGVQPCHTVPFIITFDFSRSLQSTSLLSGPRHVSQARHILV